MTLATYFTTMVPAMLSPPPQEQVTYQDQRACWSGKDAPAHCRWAQVPVIRVETAVRAGRTARNHDAPPTITRPAANGANGPVGMARKAAKVPPAACTSGPGLPGFSRSGISPVCTLGDGSDTELTICGSTPESYSPAPGAAVSCSARCPARQAGSPSDLANATAQPQRPQTQLGGCGLVAEAFVAHNL